MQVLNDQQILAEVFTVLMQHLEPWKVAHFWAMCRLGEGDYVKLKDQRFASESLEDLVAEMLAHQNSPSAQANLPANPDR